jgi:hypothetical protein
MFRLRNQRYRVTSESESDGKHRTLNAGAEDDDSQCRPLFCAIPPIGQSRCLIRKARGVFRAPEDVFMTILIVVNEIFQITPYA